MVKKQAITNNHNKNNHLFLKWLVKKLGKVCSENQDVIQDGSEMISLLVWQKRWFLIFF